MESRNPKEFNTRLLATDLAANVFAELANCQEAELSRYRRGFRVSPSRVERMWSALQALEDLLSVDSEVRPDISTVSRIRAAQRRLDAKRQIAVAPWQRIGTGAVASPDDGASAVVIAGETLSGASESNS
jgi:hypothetical protein